MKVFMDDFSVYGNSFDDCLANLEKVLARCEEELGSELGKVSFYGTTRYSLGLFGV